jgi:hypothetical protein
MDECEGELHPSGLTGERVSEHAGELRPAAALTSAPPISAPVRS